MSTRADFDVVIVGGGMVGAALASLLRATPATATLRIALIEPHLARAPLPDEPLDLRVSALSRAGSDLLKTVGAWAAVTARHAAPYERMIIWDAAGSADGADTLVFDAAEADAPDLGHITENNAVAAALIDRAAALGVTLLATPVTALELGADLARVATAERWISARLVVAADGVNSAMRGLAGIAGREIRYPQDAVVAHLTPALPHGRAARQRFLPTGPLGMLPLADGRISIVWSTSPQAADDLLGLDPAAFSAAVTEASDGVLGALTLASGRARFPLRRFQADTYQATRLVLVGDAAHAVHPLAGQGVNQGLLDVLCLVDEISAALKRGEDIGDARPLGRYARARRAGNVAIGEAMHGIWRLFVDERDVVKAMRRTGLRMVNRSATLKRFFTDRALGA